MPHVSALGASNAQVYYDMTGGIPPYNVTLGNVTSTSQSTEIVLNSLPAGYFAGLAQDSNMCSSAISVEIFSPTIPAVVDNIVFSDISTVKSTITIEWDAPFDGYSDFMNFYVTIGVFNDIAQATNWAPEIVLPATNRSYTFS